MSLLAQFGRGSVGLAAFPPQVLATEATPPCAVASGVAVADPCASDVPLLAGARYLADALLGGSAGGEGQAARLEAAVDELVTVWTPAVQATSRLELLSLLANSDDAIDGIEVTIFGALASRTWAVIEWVVTGRFSAPVLFGDDRLVEPTGATVRVCGVLSAAYTGDRASRISLYYDRMALIQQMLRSTR